MNSKIYIVIVIIILCILYYFQKKKTEYIVNGVKDSTKDIVVYKNIINNFKTGMEYTYSVWLYVDDWDYMNGSVKHIMNTGTKDLSICSPGLFLHPKNNQIDIIVDILNYEKRYDKKPKQNINNGRITSTEANNKDICLKMCTTDNLCQLASYDKHNKLCNLYKTNKTFNDEKTELELYAKRKFKNTYEELNNRRVLSVNNIPLQRWFNIALVLINRNLNVYMDGKLVKSVLLEGIPISIDNNVFVNLNGGYKGKLSDLLYSKYAMSAQEIYSLYRYGNSDKEYNKDKSSGTSEEEEEEYVDENGQEKKGYLSNILDIISNLF